MPNAPIPIAAWALFIAALGEPATAACSVAFAKERVWRGGAEIVLVEFPLWIQRRVEESREAAGGCPCPYDLTSDGELCGERSAYRRGGGARPLCYSVDIHTRVLKCHPPTMPVVQCSPPSYSAAAPQVETYPPPRARPKRRRVPNASVYQKHSSCPWDSRYGG